MDIILILIILAITTVIGYILSRPFINNDSVNLLQEAQGDPRMAYEDVLREIKTIEAEYGAGDLSENLYHQEISEKKQQAADLLRLMDTAVQLPSERINQGQSQRDIPLEDLENTHLPQEPAPENVAEKICPICGSTVVSDDKFCPNCGRSLQA